MSDDKALALVLEYHSLITQDAAGDVDALLKRMFDLAQSDIDRRALETAEPRGIVARVSRASGVSSAEILGKRRFARIALPRHVAMWACREWLAMTYVAIGAFFNCDHSSVLWAVTKIEHALTEDSAARSLVMAL